MKNRLIKEPVELNKGGDLLNWTHIYFDLDNTLYDHEQAFKETIQHCAERMLKRKGASVPTVQWFSIFKLNCDHYWNNYESGQWSRDTYQINRYCRTNDYFHLPCSTEEALAFQEEYQSKVASFAELYHDLELLLSALYEKNITLGIITNGRTEIQMAKIKALKIMKWIPRENIYISEAVGLSKPEPDFLRYVMSEEGKYLYIGDTWIHDIEPAIEAGFDAIYFNSRNEDVEQSIISVPEVSTYKELMSLLEL